MIPRRWARQNHEIRTPLVGILGMADLVLHERSVGPTTHDQLQVIYDSATSLLGLVNGILDASRLTVQQMPYTLGVRPPHGRVYGGPTDVALTAGREALGEMAPVMRCAIPWRHSRSTSEPWSTTSCAA